jgi:predicted amidohydrolase
MKSSASNSCCVRRPLSPNCRPDPRKAASSDEPVFNTQLLVDPQGEIRGRYEKLHLFDVVRLPASREACLRGQADHARKDIKGGTKILESATTKPGRELVLPVNTPIGKGTPVPTMEIAYQLMCVTRLVGMLTCYDLRFPEPSLLLRKQGTQILTYPSAFTMRTGEAHWGANSPLHSLSMSTHISYCRFNRDPAPGPRDRNSVLRPRPGPSGSTLPRVQPGP